MSANGNSTKWYDLGWYETTGGDLKIEFTSHSYFNDVANVGNTQDSIIVLRFKGGTNTDSSLFPGNAQAYRLGKNTGSPSNISIYILIQMDQSGIISLLNTLPMPMGQSFP